MGKVNSITKLEIAIFVFLTMMISGARPLLVMILLEL